MAGESLTVAAEDGRRLELCVAGPPEGRLLVFHSGTPSGPVLYRPMVEQAAARGLRVVVCARPGYAGSTPRPGRRVADVVPDVRSVLAALGAESFITVGWSGGGPHALACAAGLPGACLAAASMAGVAPFGAAGLDWLAGMGPENHAEFGAAVAGEAALTAYLTGPAAGLADVAAPDVAAELGGLASATDEAVLTGEFAEYLARSFRSAVSSGVAGWRDDDLAFVSDWGFTLAAAAAGAPVAVWQGDEDRMVPFSHGEWLAASIPGAGTHLLPGEGHLSLAVTSFGAILDDLLRLAGWPPPGREPGQAEG
jgi:pimeloyl-ACP methyl ester carboxylesterase